MKWFVPALLAISVLSVNAASGQGRPGQSRRGGGLQGFDRNAPSVGEQLPNLKAYNAAGETIQLSELKGDYTVLVFGCLT